MATQKGRLKPGMGESNNGRGRSMGTETMKKNSKKPRRAEAKRQAAEDLKAADDQELQDFLDEHNGDPGRLDDAYDRIIFGDGEW